MGVPCDGSDSVLMGLILYMYVYVYTVKFQNMIMANWYQWITRIEMRLAAPRPSQRRARPNAIMSCHGGTILSCRYFLNIVLFHTHRERERMATGRATLRKN